MVLTIDSPAAKICQCGCMATVREQFKPGHDTKLASQLWATVKEGGEEAVDATKELILRWHFDAPADWHPLYGITPENAMTHLEALTRKRLGL